MMKIVIAAVALAVTVVCGQEACDAQRQCVQDKLEEVVGVPQDELGEIGRDLHSCLKPCLTEAIESGAVVPVEGAASSEEADGDEDSESSESRERMAPACARPFREAKQQCMSDAGFEKPERKWGQGKRGRGGRVARSPGRGGRGGRGKRGGGPKQLVLLGYVNEMLGKCPQAAEEASACLDTATGGRVDFASLTPESIQGAMCQAKDECASDECAAEKEARKQAKCQCFETAAAALPEECEAPSTPAWCDPSKPAPEREDRCSRPPPSLDEVVSRMSKRGGHKGGKGGRRGGEGGRRGGRGGPNGEARQARGGSGGRRGGPAAGDA